MNFFENYKIRQLIATKLHEEGMRVLLFNYSTKPSQKLSFLVCYKNEEWFIEARFFQKSFNNFEREIPLKLLDHMCKNEELRMAMHKGMGNRGWINFYPLRIVIQNGRGNCITKEAEFVYEKLSQNEMKDLL